MINRRTGGDVRYRPMDSLTMNESGYNPYLFNSYKECIICMESFQEAEKVTALPCDERHYFHSGCILSWSERHRNCPLCKTPYDTRKIAKFNKKFVKLAAKAEERRSSVLSAASSRASISLETVQDDEENSTGYYSIDNACESDTSDQEATATLTRRFNNDSDIKSSNDSRSSSRSSRASSQLQAYATGINN